MAGRPAKTPCNLIKQNQTTKNSREVTTETILKELHSNGFYLVNGKPLSSKNININ